jgi:hypothetical protein
LGLFLAVDNAVDLFCGICRGLCDFCVGHLHLIGFVDFAFVCGVYALRKKNNTLKTLYFFLWF